MRNQLELTKEFKKALPVLKHIKEHGYHAYFVGGSVRDALLHYEVNDVDIATSAMPEEIKSIFKRTVDVGIEHGTVMVLHEGESYEVTTFRTESTYKDFRRPDSVSFVRSLKEDLKRRDFTINAFAVDETGKVIDYFESRKDLDHKIIRAVGDPEERFHEDALRMMRAIRFAGQLDFNIEKNTLEAIRHNAHLLEKIAVERIHVEFVKLLLSQARKKGMKAMLYTKLYFYCPELEKCKQALVHLANGSKQIKNERQAWALLIYYILYLHPSPEDFSITQFLRAWKTSNKVMNDVKHLVKGALYRKDHSTLSPMLVFEMGEELALEVEEMLEHISGQANFQGTKEVIEKLPIKEKNELAVSGRDVLEVVDKRPGKWLGRVLTEALHLVIDGQMENDKERLLDFVKQSVSD